MDILKQIVANIEKVIIGKKSEIYQILKGIIAGGHILIEDVPGVGKTMLVKTLARSLNLSYKRIQFTPDLLPSDITGISIYNQKSGEFEFKKGPIFANIILADEINRTSPKTQSALLEVMEEHQVSEGLETYHFEKPFIVLATQNPVDYEGTFKLPEAQLDRFMMKVGIGYARYEDESSILQIYRTSEPLSEVESVAEGADIVALREKVREVKASKDITDYITSISNATREHKYTSLGVSTRASMAMLRVAQATAFIKGRDYVTPEDVKENVEAVYGHRIILSPLARSNNMSAAEVINDIVRLVAIPGSGQKRKRDYN